MSEKSSHKNNRRRSSSSSSYSSTSSESSNEAKSTGAEKIKEPPPHPAIPVGNVNKMRLDIGYKIQQEELSDSEDSDRNSTSPRARSQSNDALKFANVKYKKRDRSKSQEKKRYRSRSNEKRRERSQSKDSRKDRSQSKDVKHELELKSGSKYECKSFDRKDRSKSKERRKERSRSRDRKKRRSRSRERKLTRSPSRDKKKERSRSREKKRDRSRSKDKLGDLSRTKEKRRERSRSRERRREKSRRDSQSPSYYKDSSSKSYIHSKRGRSRDRSSKRSRSRSRSRSRPRKRSRSRSFERSKRLYDKKFNKLSILEKLGIELKVPEGQVIGEAGANTSGFSIPSYYNPAGVNPLKYAQQMQKRRLIWGNKKQEVEPSTEKKEEEKTVKPDTAGPESVWKGTTFSQDQDGKLTAKFKRLMGIKDSGEGEGSSEKSSELIQKQEEMFSSMEKQYEVARVSTHTHRGLGLGFGVHLPR